MRGYDLKEPRLYVVEDEVGLPPEEQTTFLLKNLSVREIEGLRNNVLVTQGFGKKAKQETLVGSQQRKALETGIVGWKNFKDIAGNEIPFNLENINRIPIPYRTELAFEIMGERDEVKSDREEERKNSD